jgi:hypothetical protein
MFLQFGFVIFWRKDFGAKAAHKMLVKLTQGLYYNTSFFRNLQMGRVSCLPLTNTLTYWPHL